MSEQDIQNRIYELIKSNARSAGVEVSVLNRCIDIVYLNEDEELITIEVKLRDWRKALRQASDHQLYADKSYICLPKPRGEINQTLLATLEQSGIGLFWFEVESSQNELRFEKQVEARKSGSSWPVARKKVESFLQYA